MCCLFLLGCKSYNCLLCTGTGLPFSGPTMGPKKGVENPGKK